MPFRVYNTLSQQVEEFQPQDGRTVRMYTCGPTVYSYVHIGNLRTFTFQDLLRRWLHEQGFVLDHVMNITDVEDKIIRNAMAAGQSIREYTIGYEQAFLEDMATLRLQQPERMVRATDHIDGMIRMIEGLGEKGYTYQSDGSTYFRVANFPEYGKLSHRDFSGMVAGARVDVDEYDKDDARDFVLWKARKEGEPCWHASLGDGRPGWHIECSVMAMQYLGETLDIHAGGIDLAFPHHENEIAQSEALTGKPFSRFWLHSEHLIVEGQKMSKSLGNFYTLRDLQEKGYAPEVVRYLLASVPYRNKLNFTFDGLKAASASIDRLRSFQLRLQTDRLTDGINPAWTERTQTARAQFRDALNDDLNTAEALAAVFEYLRQANSGLDAGDFLAGNAPGAHEFLADFDRIFAVLEPTVTANALPDTEVERLIAERTQAKKSKQFAQADAIRAELDAQGIILEDTKDGVRWKRK